MVGDTFSDIPLVHLGFFISSKVLLGLLDKQSYNSHLIFVIFPDRKN